MASLSSEQKVLLKSLYRTGERIIKLESHLEFLSQSLQLKFIPKRFQVKNNLPGNYLLNEERLKLVSIQSIKDEKQNHENSVKSANVTFEKLKSRLKDIFDAVTAQEELKRLVKHLDKVKNHMKYKKHKKIVRDTSVTIANDDDTLVAAHKQNNGGISENTTGNTSVTIVSDDDIHVAAHRIIAKRKKKKRRFKRIYLQPQPKRKRKRGRRTQATDAGDNIEHSSDNIRWNDIVKNISEIPVTATEAKLLGKGKKFCPVELDPLCLECKVSLIDSLE